MSVDDFDTGAAVLLKMAITLLWGTGGRYLGRQHAGSLYHCSRKAVSVVFHYNAVVHPCDIRFGASVGVVWVQLRHGFVIHSSDWIFT